MFMKTSPEGQRPLSRAFFTATPTWPRGFVQAHRADVDEQDHSLDVLRDGVGGSRSSLRRKRKIVNWIPTG